MALELPIDHPGFHPTSLVRFRARLLPHGKERLVFERSLEFATELGQIEGEAAQIGDSTEHPCRRQPGAMIRGTADNLSRTQSDNDPVGEGDAAAD